MSQAFLYHTPRLVMQSSCCLCIQPCPSEPRSPPLLRLIMSPSFYTLGLLLCVFLGLGMGAGNDPEVKVYQKGSFTHFEHVQEDTTLQSRNVISIWISQDGKRLGWYLVSLYPKAPGNLGGHLASRSEQPLSASILSLILPPSSTRTYAETFLSGMTSSNTTTSNSPTGDASSQRFPVKAATKGTFLLFEQDWLPTPDTKQSIQLLCTEDRRFLSFTSLLDHSQYQGALSGQFWAESVLPPAALAALLPKCQARSELETFLNLDASRP